MCHSIHGNTYDYSHTEYIGAKHKVSIICQIHGEFRQLPFNHIGGDICPKCSWDKLSKDRNMGIDSFLERAVLIHGNKYNYEKVVFKSSKSYIAIICPEHGEFIQRVTNHLSGRGCPVCKESSGEKLVSSALLSLGINNFERQKRLIDSQSGHTLYYDFYFVNQGREYLIEFDGVQHYEVVDYFGGPEGFRETKERDAAKDRLSNECKMTLIRIPYYKQDDILEIIASKLKE